MLSLWSEGSAMSTISAIYQDGVFKPLDAVPLAGNQRVVLDVRPVPPFDLSAWLERVRRRQQDIVSRCGVLPDSTADIAADRRRDG
jgi:predicted DNA-binding antitoxin AbrB/MazE fold protein